MPHFVLEYSDNLAVDADVLQSLFAGLIDNAVESGLFPLKGMRCRAHPCHDYRMADGNPEHAFAHLEIKIGVGRSLDERDAFTRSSFDVLKSHLADDIARRGVALSIELRELESVTKYNANNVGDYL